MKKQEVKTPADTKQIKKRAEEIFSKKTGGFVITGAVINGKIEMIVFADSIKSDVFVNSIQQLATNIRKEILMDAIRDSIQ